MSRRHSRFTVFAALALIAACTDRSPTQARLDGARLELAQVTDPTALILTDPHQATLHVGNGIILRARIIDADGNVLTEARPAWRSTNTSVVVVNPLPDSAGTDRSRAAVAAAAIGDALVIASYNGLADTSRITVVARPDSASPPNGGGNSVPRPLTFDATIRVRGFVASADTGTTGTVLVPGSRVTLMLLPLAPGDSLPPGVTGVTSPTVVSTVTVDASSDAVFHGVPQSRFRVEVVPPSASGWQSAEFTSGPPVVGNYGRIVTVRKP